MSKLSKKVTLSRGWTPGSKNGFPVARLKGAWLSVCGFNPGDQVIISNPAPGTLVMKTYKRVNEIIIERKINSRKEGI
jgi:hypothetical protein